MFDLNIVSKRYFTIKIGELVLEVAAPKLKALKKITALSKAKNEDTMDELAEAVGMILSKNKSGHNVPDELIDDLDLDQMSQILTAYFEWLSKTKNSPN